MKANGVHVAVLGVEGVHQSALARLDGLSWKTAARWLELAAELALTLALTLNWAIAP